MKRFPERGRSHHRRREFETPRDRVLADLDMHCVELGGERLIICVLSPVLDGYADHDAGLLGAILDATPLGVVLYDRDLRIVRVNRAAGAWAAFVRSTSGCASRRRPLTPIRA